MSINSTHAKTAARRPRAYAPDPDAPDRACDIPGCPCAAGYRAPKSRDKLSDYFWFCLDHVRAYNASWDFYRGMSPGQIEAHLRADTSWGRPSWKLGSLGSTHGLEDERIADPLGILGAGRLRRDRRGQTESEGRPPELREPLAELGLGWPLSLDELKARYKDLARRHHPDANGGDRASEERFKLINVAYDRVLSHLNRNSHPEPAAHTV